MSESDPFGFDRHEPGAKLDKGKEKVAFALSQFFTALANVNGVSEYGAEKYTVNGWRDVPDGENRYLEALLRHLAKHKDGELFDKDTGLLHVSHMAWNALAVLEFVCKNLTLQSTPKPQVQTSEEKHDHILYQPAPKTAPLEGGLGEWTHSPGPYVGKDEYLTRFKSTSVDTQQCSTMPSSISEVLGPLKYV